MARAGLWPLMTGDWSKIPNCNFMRSGGPDDEADESAEEQRQPEDADHALLVGASEAFLLLPRVVDLEHHQRHAGGKDDPHPFVDFSHDSAPAIPSPQSTGKIFRAP